MALIFFVCGGVLLYCCLCISDCCLVRCRLIVYLLLLGGGTSPGLFLERSAQVFMSSSSVGLPDGPESGPHVPWTSSIALSRFVMTVQLGVGVGSGPRVECRRAALAVWIRKLDVSANGCESGAPASSADEAMLD